MGWVKQLSIKGRLIGLPLLFEERGGTLNEERGTSNERPPTSNKEGGTLNEGDPSFTIGQPY